MFAAAIITLRETLEASLVVGIVLAYLDRTQNRSMVRYVWMGVAAGISVSIGIAWGFEEAFSALMGSGEQIYEGVTMLIAAVLLTWMILWMLKQRRTIRASVEESADAHVRNQYPLGIFFLTFISTAREGIETVIFLKALILHSDVGFQIFGGLAGVVLAVGLSYFLFRGLEILPLSKIFSFTSILLIVFAAGLLAHAVHEFQEAGFLPFLATPLWNLNPPVLADGSYPLLHDHGAIGGLLHALVGYQGEPFGLELLVYVGYLGVTGFLFRRGSVRA